MTRGGGRTQHANSAHGWTSTLSVVTQGVEPTIATRGGRRTQHANSAQGAGRPRITTPSQNRKKGRGWHTNREGGRSVLVSHLAISCRDPKRFGPAIATRGGCQPQPESNQRRKTGSQAVFRTDEYLTPGWIQPPDKPVSVFDGMGPDTTV